MLKISAVVAASDEERRDYWWAIALVFSSTRSRRALINGESQNSVANAADVAHGRNVVDAQNICLPGDRGRTSGSRPPDAVLRIGALEEFADKAFTGNAHQEGATETTKFVAALNEFEIVGNGLAEANPRIDRDPPARNSHCLGSGNANAEMAVNVVNNLAIAGVALHGAGGSLHVHQDDGRL